MKLECISAYSNKPLKVAYAEGDVFEVDEKIGQHLLHDSPDSFVDLSALEAAEQAMTKLQTELEQKPDDQGQTQAPDEQASKGKKKATE
ncbi:hypothetical protein [Herpetosiphon giganteus]|uniref:hypothetical protein n=1 Tax=Herpetosiphon giganteus TaxID=2029754 RepID=UPI001957A7EF|nr:hypothetical protein [Herpetosiphon giganteus]MBM7843765.1 hypothetical protein [Herpetosiphon giganteus]